MRTLWKQIRDWSTNNGIPQAEIVRAFTRLPLIFYVLILILTRKVLI